MLSPIQVNRIIVSIDTYSEYVEVKPTPSEFVWDGTKC